MSESKIDLDLVLSFPMGDNDAEAENVGYYLYSLLFTLWAEGEGFSGKRPFGNSDWQYELYKPLIAGGFVEGKLDEDGYIDYVNKVEAYDLILQCINRVFKNYLED